MGTVWLAQHLALGHTVAIKLIEPRGDPTVAHARFMREAKLVAAIRHRNVVEITDFGTAPNGHPFMVMEYLEGRSLDDRLEEGPMGIGEAVSIGARLLSGLAAAHDAGILHHDLKPANVLLLSDPDGEYPKLIDFGISKSLQAGLESVFATQENLVTGTPRYMSPEQSRGLREMDARSDLFSVGIMLYEMLTCELPFDGESAGDILFKLQTERAPPVDRLRPDVPPPIARVVERALEKHPANRFADARSMRKALLEAADGVVSDAEGEASGYAPSIRPPPAVAAALRAALDEAVEPQDQGVLNLRSLHPPPMPGAAGDPTQVAPARARALSTLRRWRTWLEVRAAAALRGVQGGSGRRRAAAAGGLVLLVLLVAWGLWSVRGPEGDPATVEAAEEAPSAPAAEVPAPVEEETRAPVRAAQREQSTSGAATGDLEPPAEPQPAAEPGEEVETPSRPPARRRMRRRRPRGVSDQVLRDPGF